MDGTEHRERQTTHDAKKQKKHPLVLGRVCGTHIVTASSSKRHPPHASSNKRAGAEQVTRTCTRHRYCRVYTPWYSCISNNTSYKISAGRTHLTSPGNSVGTGTAPELITLPSAALLLLHPNSTENTTNQTNSMRELATKQTLKTSGAGGGGGRTIFDTRQGSDDKKDGVRRRPPLLQGRPLQQQRRTG